jgi:ABC-2 type transport system permease protein
MGIIILVLNGALGEQPLPLILVLALGATMAASFGVLMGALVKDINTLFATIKAIGILLYAPALIYIFPQVPQWISRIFPTYYIIGPVIEITQNRWTWGDIAVDIAVLIGEIVLLIFAISLLSRRMRESVA